MKKLIMFGLSLATVATLGTTIAHASITDHGDGTQTIDNSSGPTETEADVAITGYLGLNNTDPNSPETTDPDEWINVTLPTKAIFQSDAANKHDTLISPKHTIKNNSGRPVRVEVEDYTGDIGSIASLDVNSGSNKISLISSNTLVSAPTGTLMTLDSPSPAAGSVFSGPTADFTFTGTTDATWSALHKPENLNSTLTLNFVPLKADGTDY